MPTSSDASFTLKFKMADGMDTGSGYNLAAENDNRVISAVATMFSGTPNRPTLQTASIPYDSGEQHHVQTVSTNNLETETDMDAISRVL